MDLPNTNNGASNYVATEIVYNNSSPLMPRIGLPVARVLKRKEGHYIRPRSPVPPTLPGCRMARLKCNFIRTKGMTLRDVE